MLHAVLTLGPLAAVMVVAVVVASALGRWRGFPPETGRLVSLDGLRGYLALGVYAHHAMRWHSFVQPGHDWMPANLSRLYVHAGESAVTVFFMMTGFLFGAKLAEGRRRPIDWTRLYVSRVLRIYPLYGVALAAVLLVVAVESRGRLHTPPAALAHGVLAWAHFARPDLNGVPNTWLIVSGVPWSLEYEWMFYCALPLAALCFGVRPPWRWLAAGAVGTALWSYWLSKESGPPPHLEHLGEFGAGALASVVTRHAQVRAALGGWVPACGALAAAALVPVLYDEPYQWPVLALLVPLFLVVASGNTLFGVLRLPASRLLGEISYSIYLLHGLVLFVVLRGVLGMPAAAALPPGAYWGLIVALTAVVVAGAFATFRLVERPAIRATPHAQRWLAERMPRRRGAPEPAAAVPVRA